MAPINNFNISLTSNGINFSTSDPNFENAGFAMTITQGDGSKSYFGDSLSGGVGGSAFASFGFTSASQPVFPLTIDVVFDDNNSGSFGGSGDRIWTYHITSQQSDNLIMF